MWDALAPGGLYFLEDLNVGRSKRWDDTHGTRVVSDVLQSWIEQQLTVVFGYQGDTPETQRAKEMRRRFPRPRHLAFIHCQDAACVLGKRPDAGPGFGTGGTCRSLMRPRKQPRRASKPRP